MTPRSNQSSLWVESLTMRGVAAVVVVVVVVGVVVVVVVADAVGVG